MSSAKLYVSTNVVDRLTRPIQAPGTGGDLGHGGGPSAGGSTFDITYGGDRTVMDITSFMGALNGGTGGAGGPPGSTGVGGGGGGHVGSSSGNQRNFQTPQQGHRQQARRPSSAPRERSASFSGTSGGTGLKPEEKEARQQQFLQFLGRQEQSLIKKERNVKEVCSLVD